MQIVLIPFSSPFPFRRIAGEIELIPLSSVLNEFYRVAFRKKLYRSLEELQADLDRWLTQYNEERPHQGRWCYGKTPIETFIDSIPLAREKMIAA